MSTDASNEAIKAALTVDAAGYRRGERVVTRFSDGPPLIFAIGDGSFADRTCQSWQIWGRVTAEVEALIIEREAEFKVLWG